MKGMRKILMGILFLGVIFFCAPKEIRAAETDTNIRVTVPSNLNIKFQEDGTNEIDDFKVQNDSLVPIHVTNVKLTESNGWKIVPKGTVITVDQKQIAFRFNETYLKTGDNAVQVKVAEQSVKNMPVEVIRGAWNKSYPKEKAFEIELEYQIGTKEFRITFDGDGSDHAIADVKANNGDELTLPVPSKIKYRFLGWEDTNGTLYNGAFEMPIGNVNLKAKWQWTEAYAYYAASDKSLTFVRSVEPIKEGKTYDGKKVTEVYTGFEETMYGFGKTPWQWAGGVYGTDIVKVEVKDVIQPKSTAAWFFCMRHVEYFDLGKLDMSKVTNMVSMFSSAGEEVTGTFTLKGVDTWDVSNVQYMGSAFRAMGKKAKTFVMDDVSGWNTSKAEDMAQLFYETGLNAKWKRKQDCSQWTVSNVTSHTDFCKGVTDKVTQPKWVK